MWMLMRKRERYFALAVAAAGLLWSAAGRAVAQEDRIFWFSDYKEALQEAKKTQKPIFLEFRCEA
jgi:uncharacterized membrane protein YfbV (UPF0208 family)